MCVSQNSNPILRCSTSLIPIMQTALHYFYFLLEPLHCLVSNMPQENMLFPSTQFINLDLDVIFSCENRLKLTRSMFKLLPATSNAIRLQSAIVSGVSTFQRFYCQSLPFLQVNQSLRHPSLLCSSQPS